MNMTRLHVVFLVVTTVAMLRPPAATWAAEKEPPPLTAEEVEAAVMSAFPEIQAAQAAVAAAEGELKAARLLPDPFLELGRVRNAARDGSRVESEPTRALEWELPLPWSYRPGKAVAAANVAAVRAELAGTELAVRARVRRLLVELAAAQERVELLAAQRATIKKAADLISLRVDRGESRELERLRVTVEVERIERELALASGEASALAATLARLSGSLPPDFRLAFRLGSSVPEAEAPQLVERALATNPLLARQRADVERALAAVALARGLRSPSLLSRAEESSDLENRSRSFSIGLRLPLWNANRGEIAAAKARLRQAQANLEATQRELSALVASATRRLRAALAAARRLQDTALPAAKAAQDIADFSLRQGEIALTDFLDTRRAFLVVALEELEARRQLHLLRTELEALGALPIGVQAALPPTTPQTASGHTPAASPTEVLP